MATLLSDDPATPIGRTRNFVCSCDPMPSAWRVSYATDPATMANYKTFAEFESKMREFVEREHAKHIAACNAATTHVTAPDDLAL